MVLSVIAAGVIATLIVSAVQGSMAIPMLIIDGNKAKERASLYCRQIRWNQHRALQLKTLATKLDEDYERNVKKAIEIADNSN